MSNVEQFTGKATSYLERALSPVLGLVDNGKTIEIALNPDGSIWAEQAGDAVMKLTQYRLTTDELRLLATQLAGQESLSPEKPMVSTSFERGGENWRVQVIAPPLVERGYAISLRHNVVQDLTLDDLEQQGAFSFVRASITRSEAKGRSDVLDWMADKDYKRAVQAAVVERWNILVSGGTSTGKTTIARAALHEAAPTDRIITIEEGFELLPRHENKVSLRASKDGPNTANALLEASLRMRPDRIILGELRGKEAWSFLEAINTGHPGSLTTIHANTPLAAFERLSLMSMRADLGIAKAEIIDYAQSVIDMVIQVARDERTGQRYISEILVS